MKVKELIERLSKFDQEKEVRIVDLSASTYPILDIGLAKYEIYNELPVLIKTDAF